MFYIVFISSKTNEHKYCYGLSKHMQKLQKLNFSRRNGWRCRYLVTVKVAVELIMIVKRTQMCMTWNGPFDSENERVLICQFKLQADSWLSGILATEVMVLCLACFENQGQQRL